MDRENKIRIAIYDMDKTVTRRATYNGFLMHMAWNKSPWRLLMLPVLPLGLMLYALKIWSRSQLKQFSQSLLIGRKVPRIQFARHLERHADLVLGKNVYQEAKWRIDAEKSDGYRHVIATASYRLYVEAIAAKLGFDDVIATELATDDSGHVLARIDGHNCYDEAKLDRESMDGGSRSGTESMPYTRLFRPCVRCPLALFCRRSLCHQPTPAARAAGAGKGMADPRLARRRPRDLIVKPGRVPV